MTSDDGFESTALIIFVGRTQVEGMIRKVGKYGMIIWMDKQTVYVRVA